MGLGAQGWIWFVPLARTQRGLSKQGGGILCRWPSAVLVAGVHSIAGEECGQGLASESEVNMVSAEIASHRSGMVTQGVGESYASVNGLQKRMSCHQFRE